MLFSIQRDRPQFQRGSTAMLEYSDSNLDHNRISHWMIRGGIALAFVLFGLEKFSSRPDSCVSKAISGDWRWSVE